MRLRAEGLGRQGRDPEQPIPNRWGGTFCALRTLSAPIGWTASVATPIGGLCLTRLYKPAAHPSLCLSQGGLDLAYHRALAGPGWAAQEQSGEADRNTPCETLVNT